MPSQSRQRPPAKKWLSTEVSAQWVAGLVIGFIVWAVNNERNHAQEIAVLKSQMAEKAGLVERRNRELDTMQTRTDRQEDRFERRIIALEDACRRSP